MAELIDIARQAVALATAAGANGVWATAERSRSVDLKMRQGKLDLAQDATSRSLSLRLFVDGRYGGVSTNDLREDRLKSFVDEAVALTRAIQQDPMRELPDPKLFEGRPQTDLQLVDPAVPAISREDRLAWLEEMNALLRGEAGVVSADSTVSDGHAETAMASSNGFDGTEARTWLWLGSDITVKGADGKLTEEGMHGGGTFREDLPPPAEIARMALARARAREGSVKGPTRKTTMIVDPQSAGRLLGRFLSGASGSAVERDQSFWKGKLGKKVGSDKLTVVDDPLLVRGLSSRAFDREGIAAKPLPLVEAGVLRNYYLDTYYAKKLAMAPTTGSASNRTVALGKRDLAGLIAQAKSGIYVTSWLGGNADGTTGDFSFGLRGHLVENGKIGAPVGEMNVTGNLADLFSRLVEVGNDPWPYSSLKAPTLVFEGVDFSGA